MPKPFYHTLLRSINYILLPFTHLPYSFISNPINLSQFTYHSKPFISKTLKLSHSYNTEGKHIHSNILIFISFKIFPFFHTSLRPPNTFILSTTLFFISFSVPPLPFAQHG